MKLFNRIIRFAFILLSMLTLTIPALDAQEDLRALQERARREAEKAQQLEVEVRKQELRIAVKKGVIDARSAFAASLERATQGLDFAQDANRSLQESTSLFSRGNDLIRSYRAATRDEDDIKAWAQEALQLRGRIFILRKLITTTRTEIAAAERVVKTAEKNLRHNDGCILSRQPTQLKTHELAAYQRGCTKEYENIQRDHAEYFDNIATARDRFSIILDNADRVEESAITLEGYLETLLRQFPEVLTQLIHRRIASTLLAKYRDVSFTLDIEDAFERLERQCTRALAADKNPFEAMNALRRLATLHYIVSSEILPSVKSERIRNDLEIILGRKKEKIEEIQERLERMDVFDLAQDRIDKVRSRRDADKADELQALLEYSRHMGSDSLLFLEIIFGAPL